MSADYTTLLDCFNKSIFANRMNADQSSGVIAILDEWHSRKLTDERWLAYMLGTVHLETNATMQPVREAYWLSENWRKTNLRYYPYYGRGLPQLTWEYNYRTMNDLLRPQFIEKYPDFDLVIDPDQALFPDIAVAVMFEGMLHGRSNRGDFTGKSLEDYFNDSKTDWIGARYIINGQDRAIDIAETSKQFYACLIANEKRPGRLAVPRPLPMLQYGMVDKEVAGGLIRKLQTVLAQRLYYYGFIDGQFGPKTLAAVKAFQRDANVTVDGVVGDITRGLLGLTT